MRMLLLTMMVAVATVAAAPAVQPPVNYEWPQLYPLRAVAPGFRTASGAEDQWREGKWVPASRQLHAYDAGRLTSVTYESDLNGKWLASRRETFRYDGVRLIEILVQESIGPTLQNRARHSLAWADNRPATESIDAWSHEQRWTPIRRNVTTYDKAGRRQFDLIHVGDNAQPGSRIEWRYDASGRVIEQLKQQPQGRAWMDTERIVHKYDASGRLSTVSMFARRGAAEWIESFRINHSYAAPGLGTDARIVRFPTSGGPMRSFRFIVTQVLGRNGLQDSQQHVLTFDSAGNQIETRFQGWNGSAWVDGRRETWTYEAR